MILHLCAKCIIDLAIHLDKQLTILHELHSTFLINGNLINSSFYSTFCHSSIGNGQIIIACLIDGEIQTLITLCCE